MQVNVEVLVRNVRLRLFSVVESCWDIQLIFLFTYGRKLPLQFKPMSLEDQTQDGLIRKGYHNLASS